MTTPHRAAVDRGETMARFHEYRRTQSRELRNQLIEEHRGFGEYLARRFSDRGEPLDDLRQVALVGLLKAVERFEPERGLSFTTFAGPTIVGELKRHFRDRTWSVRVPRRLQELSLRIERSRGELGQQLGHPPTLDEIADEVGVTVEQVLEGMEAASLYRIGSLDVPAADRDDRSVGDRVGGLDSELSDVEDRAVVRDLLASLPVRERHIVYLRFFEGLTQAEIAERVGVSQMHVSRLLSRSLDTLGAQIAEDSPGRDYERDTSRP
jgi:RNA polymerase sigma-B factor